MNDEEFEETENYIRFGKGKNTILVGKNQLLELLKRGYTVNQALLHLAEQNQIAWVKGGEICQRMMINQFKYLWNLGVPVDKIIEHFKKEFPVEFKCLTGESISDEEIKKNIAELIKKFESPSPSVASPPAQKSSPEPAPAPAPEPEPQKPEPQEPEEPPKLGDKPVETEDDLELYAMEKEGWCCGVNPRVLAILSAVEKVSPDTANDLLKRYVSESWSEVDLYTNALKHVSSAESEDEFVDDIINSLPDSNVRKIWNIIQKKEQNPKQIFKKYLQGEIKSLIMYAVDTYSSELSELI